MSFGANDTEDVSRHKWGRGVLGISGVVGLREKLGSRPSISGALVELADRETRKSVRQIVSKALDFSLII